MGDPCWDFEGCVGSTVVPAAPLVLVCAGASSSAAVPDRQLQVQPPGTSFALDVGLVSQSLLVLCTGRAAVCRHQVADQLELQSKPVIIIYLFVIIIIINIIIIIFVVILLFTVNFYYHLLFIIYFYYYCNQNTLVIQAGHSSRSVPAGQT